ncbi:MAG: hypothetical protein HQL54_07805 [Magnetococcales bacterium]|nr:hypothetical protein [Magnetococcales bacterium]
MAWIRFLGALLAVFMTIAPLVSNADAHGDAKHDRGTIGEKCIKDTDWMRRNHMNMLMEKRHVTVREGVRVPAESLLNCKTCHTSREKFCDKCHSYVGVQPDCFECHNYPK